MRDFIDKDNPERIQPEEVEVPISRQVAERLGLTEDEDDEMEENDTFVCSIPIYRCNMRNLGVDVVRIFCCPLLSIALISLYDTIEKVSQRLSELHLHSQRMGDFCGRLDDKGEPSNY